MRKAFEDPMKAARRNYIVVAVIVAVALLAGCIWYGKIAYTTTSSCARLTKYMEINSKWSGQECRRQLMLRGLRYLD